MHRGVLVLMSSAGLMPGSATGIARAVRRFRKRVASWKVVVGSFMVEV